MTHPLPLPRGEHPFSMGWGLAAQGLFTHNKETEPMFDSLEPEANDNQESNSLPLPPRSGANNKGTRPLNLEKVRHMLYGSLAAIVCAASPERRIAPSKSSMRSAMPTPTMVAIPSPCAPCRGGDDRRPMDGDYDQNGAAGVAASFRSQGTSPRLSV